jgi:hypothetical protein
VLELGAGRYSTPFFLSRPIERLTSIETDERWFAAMEEAHDDRRLHLLHGRGELNKSTLGGFDLIFIDDGQNALERADSIAWVLGQPHPPTIIHDAEVYATVIAEFTPNFSVMPTDPGTAVVW